MSKRKRDDNSDNSDNNNYRDIIVKDSRIYLQDFITKYDELFNVERDCLKMDVKKYEKFLSDYGLINDNPNNYEKINDNPNNYEKINDFKQKISILVNLPKNNINWKWILENIDKIISIFSQIQTDNTVPEAGHYMYRDGSYPPMSASGYLLFFLLNIKKNLTGSICRYGINCYNHKYSHLKKFFHNKPYSKRQRTSAHGKTKKRKNKPNKHKSKKLRKQITQKLKAKSKLKRVKTRSKPKNKKK
jgi:hypothetical protein